MKGALFYILIGIAGVFLLSSCQPKTRYEVLSFFFDGVPDPEAQGQQKSGDSGKKGGGEPAERASTHGPYGARMCSACHDPSTNALLLPKDKLCGKCHDVARGSKQHGPVASGGCLVCHDPHRSGNRYLLVASSKVFCIYCHDAREIASREAHRGVTASCTECHNPHGSDNAFFLR